jgi:hypothetical protein
LFPDITKYILNTHIAGLVEISLKTKFLKAYEFGAQLTVNSSRLSVVEPEAEKCVLHGIKEVTMNCYYK